MEDLDDSFLAESAGSTSFLSLNNDTVGTTLSQRIEGDTEEVLHSVFGHRSFRCGQRDVINRILNGESTLFVTSTGKRIHSSQRMFCQQSSTYGHDSFFSLVLYSDTNLLQDPGSRCAISFQHACYPAIKTLWYW